jgi:hypothetical protein
MRCLQYSGLLLAVLLLLGISSIAQHVKKPYVEKISIAATKGLTLVHLDGVYTSAVHTDTTKAVFKNKLQADEFTKAYQIFLKGIGKYLKENGFKWGAPTRCWNKIYFNKSGTVDYFLFDFKTPISDEKMEQFKKMLTAYLQDHKINIVAPVKFAQCGPVMFMDK